MEQPKAVSRKDKRKALKKDKRKHIRKELAEKARAEEEARLNDPDLQQKIQLEEEREKERLEIERKEFEERERIFLQELEKKKEDEEEEEEEERMNAIERESKLHLEGAEEGSNEDDEWEYVEEGPPEIIWLGNEIIVKKNKVRVKKRSINHDMEEEDPNRPTSNPLPPRHDVYAAFRNAPMTSAELLDNVAQQVPNFGTEQDKAHCPFHIKTGACRFGSHCNRVHYYPDKSNTLLIKNMYSGPGLAWEQDEGLEVCCWAQAVILYTEEEVEHSYEEFYEDVHTEFLKFGEIINFKVCRNGSFHLRGNVYVHYKSLDSAMMAYSSVHGRYFAGKQVKCEFVSLTRWKVAICGEYMKSRLKTCSRGSACNFLHCFSNPGRDYEWADCDKPPPRYWVTKMTALFGSDEIDQPSPNDQQHSSRIFTSDRNSYHSKRHRSIDSSQHNGSSSRSYSEEPHARKRRRREHQEDHNVYEDETEYKNNHPETDSDGDQLERKRQGDRSENHSMHIKRESKSRENHRRTHGSRGNSPDEDLYMYTKRKSRHRKNISESSSIDAKTEPSEGDLIRQKQQKTRSTRRRSRHDDRDEVDHQESKKVEGRSRHRLSRSRSHDKADKNDMTDRWQPAA